MKITFQNQEENRIESSEAGRQRKAEQTVSKKAYGAYTLSLMSSAEKNYAVGDKGKKQKGSTMADLQEQAANVDVGIQQDFMTLMSNTLSEEDYAKLEEDGFRFSDMEPEMAVTIVDKIKAELVRGGKHVPGYTDDVNVEVLSEALGSETLARAVEDSFAKADVPVTAETVKKISQAWDMTKTLEEPTDGTYRYMIDNALAPEIGNLYMAQSSGAGAGEVGRSGYYAEDVQGYFAQSAVIDSAVTEEDVALLEQMDKVILQAGMEENEESRQAARWLLEQDLPLTSENLNRLQELKEVAFPIEEKVFAGAVANAVSEGKSPLQARLTIAENLYERAASTLQRFAGRKQLEEIRLKLTAEVNVKLLKSGFSIDTAPMEQLIEAIKEAEAEIAARYFPGDSEAVAKYETYQVVNRVVSELPSLPASSLGSISILGEDAVSLMAFHAEGKSLQAGYEAVKESYESLMTAPRSDLGDNIRKAFANVDDILQDLNYELSEQNRRAVRILGYNRMEMNTENVELVKAADSAVRSVIDKMTPAATLRMIRDGVNPLEKTFEELNIYFDNQSESYEESSESYSRFLHGLEKRGDITPEERESYIGIYRLVHQIEKTDGAAIGALINTQAELHFSNLLSAVRTGKFKHLDIKANDELGTLEELIRKGETIPEQIAKGFVNTAKGVLTEVSYSEGAAEEYRSTEWQRLRDAGKVSQESTAMLSRGELPATAGNLLAAAALASDSVNPYRSVKDKLSKKSEETEDVIDRLGETLEKLDDREGFIEHLSSVLEEVTHEVEEFSFMQGDTSVDVKEMQLLHKQLTVVGALAQKEEYILPMYIGEELSKVHLTFRKDDAERGSIRIQVEYGEDSHVQAHLQMREKRLTGFLMANTREEVMKLAQTADIFSKSLKEQMGESFEAEELPIVDARQAAVAERTREKTTDGNTEAGGPDNAQLYEIAKLFLQAIRQQETR